MIVYQDWEELESEEASKEETYGELSHLVPTSQNIFPSKLKLKRSTQDCLYLTVLFAGKATNLLLEWCVARCFTGANVINLFTAVSYEFS
jgi:hypothetical protein